jgi:Rrf2 family protein
MVDMAIHAAEGPVSLKSISSRQNLPENYLEQIFLALRRSKLVDSTRGVQGGYMLARPAEDITVLEVLNALEGPLAPVACILAEKGEDCERYPRCATRAVWQKVKDALDETAASITLGDLVVKYRTSCRYEDAIEYYI